MTPDLGTEVVINRDFPEQGLRAGDLGVFIEYLENPSGGEDGAMLEIFNVLGDLVRLVTVPLSAIEPRRADQVPSARWIDVRWYDEGLYDGED